MCVLITRTGLYREYVWKDQHLPPRVKVPVPAPPRYDWLPSTAGTLPEEVGKTAEFYKIGLTDCYGRPIYVQRW